MSNSTNAQNYIIQIDLAGGPQPSRGGVDMQTVQQLFAGTGIKLDANYGPICINPQQRRFVVRGRATTAARRRAEKILGKDVKFFADGRIQPSAVDKKH